MKNPAWYILEISLIKNLNYECRNISLKMITNAGKQPSSFCFIDFLKISLQDVGNHSTPQILFSIICELPSFGKDSGVLSSCILCSFSIHLPLFLDRLPHKAGDPSLLCYYPITGGRTNGFMPLLKTLVQKWILQTRLTNSTFCTINHYTTPISTEFHKTECE